MTVSTGTGTNSSSGTGSGTNPNTVKHTSTGNRTNALNSTGPDTDTDTGTGSDANASTGNRNSNSMAAADAHRSPRLPHLAAFPQALGTGIIVTCSQPLPHTMRRRIARLIEEFEASFSRFRRDSLVGRIATSSDGGTFEFPSGLGAESLFALYDRLFTASRGTMDPLVGAELTELGYNEDMAFRMRGDDTPETAMHDANIHTDGSVLDNAAANIHDNAAAGSRNNHNRNQSIAVTYDGRTSSAAPSFHADRYADVLQRRPTWQDDVSHHSRFLTVDRSMRLDFGAAGKGMTVDLLANMIEYELPGADYVIDAGGDLRVHLHAPARPLTVAMEDPDDESRAIGTAAITDGALCASAPSRRHWRIRAGDVLREVHHLLNAVDGTPANDVKATWVFVPRGKVLIPTKSPVESPVKSPESSTKSSPDGHPYPCTTDDIDDLRLHYPTMLADGLATALFVAEAGDLAHEFSTQDGTPAFECAMLDAGRNAGASAHFPGRLFTV
ncbi:FAD:protein FMN transferase [Bifidobacterium catulorum]|nr:FAD:protein FMN transferase [Bifidobacterium catulorum]